MRGPAVLRTLPEGALAVGTGLGLLGASTYGFLLLSARQVSTTAFAGLSVLYVLVYTVVPGVFLPLEQEIGRALAERRARGVPAGSLLRGAARLSLGALVGLVVVCGIVCPFVVHKLFNGSWLLCVGLLLSVVGEGAAYATRGVLAGNKQFRSYGVQLGVEGLARLALCVVLAVAGVRAVGPYGVLLGGAFLVAVLATAPAIPRNETPGPPLNHREFTGALGWLVVGSVLAQTLVNFGPVAVKLFSSTASAAAGELLAGLVLARLPLFLFAAVQAALLPNMASALAVGKVAEFQIGMRKLLLVLSVLAAGMTAVMGIAGPPLVRLVFGTPHVLDRAGLVLLSVATGLYMAANVVANGLLALQRFRLAVLGWAFGAVALALIMAGPGLLVSRVEYSFLGGTFASVVAFAVMLRYALRSHRRTGRGTPVFDVVGGP